MSFVAISNKLIPLTLIGNGICVFAVGLYEYIILFSQSKKNGEHVSALIVGQPEEQSPTKYVTEICAVVAVYCSFLTQA